MYSAAKTLRRPPSATVLTARMVGIGMLIASEGDERPLIEETLVYASESGMVGKDFRVLDVLVNWIGVHCRYINADRLFRVVTAFHADRVLAFWAAVSQWRAKDRRFARLKGVHRSDRVDVLATDATDFQVGRHGEDDRFLGTCLRVPSNLLRTSTADVASPTHLAQRHRGYRNRVTMGPNWRADAWTELQEQPHLTASELAREVGCGYATAQHAKRDFVTVHGKQAAS